MTTYTVKAVRLDGWWGLTVDELPGVVSQVRSLTQAETHVREAIAFVAGVPSGNFDVRVEPELAPELSEQVRLAREASARAEAAVVCASRLTRAAISELRRAGINGRESAVIMGLSKQRISQLSRPQPTRVAASAR